MFGLNERKIVLATLLVAVIMCAPVPSWAAFESLTKAGGDIFQGLREIIYPASAIGIIAVCIGGFFGNINWKWLTAIVIGLIVISACVAFIDMFAPDANATSKIPDDIMGGI